MKNNIMNSIEYKKYNNSCEKETLNIFAKAFENYPLFEIVKDDFKTEKRYHSFYNSFMKALFRATIRKNECYIGINDGKVIDLVIIDAPTDKPVGFLDYVLSGGIKPILKLGLFNALKFLKLSDETEIVVKNIKEPRWHLYFLVVEPEYQGKGVGSDAINNFLIPFVKEKKVILSLLRLIQSITSIFIQKMVFLSSKKKLLHIKIEPLIIGVLEWIYDVI